MNYFPTFNSSSNAVYVITEELPDLFDTKNNYRIVSVVKSYALATKYLSPNRRIHGPVPMIDNDLPIRPFEIIPEKPIFDINDSIKIKTEPVVKLFEPNPITEPVVKLFEPKSITPFDPRCPWNSSNNNTLKLSNTDTVIQLFDSVPTRQRNPLTDPCPNRAFESNGINYKSFNFGLGDTYYGREPMDTTE